MCYHATSIACFEPVGNWLGTSPTKVDEEHKNESCKIQQDSKDEMGCGLAGWVFENFSNITEQQCDVQKTSSQNASCLGTPDFVERSRAAR